MPVAQPCLTCRKPTTNGARCPSCSTTYETARVARRGTQQQRGYGWAWVQRSRVAIKAHPYCSVLGCQNMDLTADHVIPIKHGGTPDGPIEVLCRKHNSSKGARLR